jgi:hypothetical protein
MVAQQRKFAAEVLDLYRLFPFFDDRFQGQSLAAALE